MSYDVQPAMLSLAAIVRTAFVPATLNFVYDNIPLIFSDAVPVMFFEYRGGKNRPDAEEQIHTVTRTWQIDGVALQCLAGETDTADKLTKAFAGMFYDLIRANPTLSSTVDKAIVTDDKIQPFMVNGGSNRAVEYLSNIFTVEVTQYFT